MMAKERKLYIDVARGVVILLVVLGHLFYIGGVDWLRIFAFHMPFFFIMSGYCTGEQSYRLPFGKYLLKNVKSLLVPAAVIRILLMPLGMSDVDFSVRPVVTEILRAGLKPDLEWFISALFLAKILFYWIHRLTLRTGDPKFQNAILFFAAGLAFYLGQTWAAKGLHNVPLWLPVRIDCTLVALSFCIAGYWCRKENFEEIYVKSRRPVLLAGGAASLVILYLMRFQTYTNVADMYYGNSSAGYFGFACVLSLYTVLLCRWVCDTLAEKNLAVRALALLGRNTLLVYPGHSILNHFFSKFLYRLTGTEFIPMNNLSRKAILLYFAVDVLFFLPACYGNERLRNFKKGHKRAAAAINLAIAAGLCAAMAACVYLARTL